MSLLMEALRKAEEAKSKAAQEDQDSEKSANADEAKSKAKATDSNEVKASGEVPTPEQSSSEDKSSEIQAADSEQEGPLVINPDPDEEETLASHTTDSILDFPSAEDDPSVEDDDLLEKIEFNTEPRERVKADSAENSPEPESEIPTLAEDSTLEGVDDDEDDIDSLSLHQSSYFTRTQKSSRPSFDEFELEQHEPDAATSPDEDTSDKSVDTSSSINADDTDDNSTDGKIVKTGDNLSDIRAEIESAESAESGEEAVPEINDFDYTEPSPDSPTEDDSDNPAPSEETKAQEKIKEKETRNSANSLFLAKEASKSRRSKRFWAVAAGVLIFPLAGVIYWLYSSMNSSPQMQFNVPAGGVIADRGFLGDDNPQALADAQQDSLNNDIIQETAEILAEDAANTESLESGTPPDEETLLADAQVSSGETILAGASQLADNQPVTEESVVVPDQPQQTAQNTLPVTNLPPINSPAPAQAETTGLSFVRTEVDNSVSPALSDAFTSYQQGNLVAAGSLYQQVLNDEPNNRDALLGLASVYLSQSNTSMAQNLYARLLELNPRDPLAMTGLLDISLREDPLRQETELKSLINAYPGVAPLPFALGNLYATQSRWSEAQSYYFNALLAAKASDSGPVNPDYAFNLAVSLERLSQLGAARDYYREAEELARNSSARFSLEQLQQRLNYLEQRLP